MHHLEHHLEHEERASLEPDAKRRKLRKGTRSCWDCKKRKVRCNFENETDTVCVPCRRRGATCISQDQQVPDEQAFQEENSGPLFHRVRRVEYLLEELLKKGQDIDVALARLASADVRNNGILTPCSEMQSTDSGIMSVCSAFIVIYVDNV